MQTRADWWHVPGSNELAQAELGSLLEQLRATRPAWTADGKSFAFVTYRPGPVPNDPGESRLWIGRLDEPRDRADRAGIGPAPRSALVATRRAARRGARLGRTAAIRDGDADFEPRSRPRRFTSGTVPAGFRARSMRRPVRRFAGWWRVGRSPRVRRPWRRPRGRAAALVVLAGARPPGEGRRHDRRRKWRRRRGRPSRRFPGCAVTFPHWSPSSSDEVLSLWCTFSPSHRSMLSRFLGGGLRSGDPAALLDARTGTLSWMAVSPVEEAQIGHYEQIKHAYAEAWRRYERAEAAAPAGSSTESAAEPKSTSGMARPVVLATRHRRVPVPLPDETGTHR